MPRKYGWLLAVTLSVIVMDQWTKFLVLQELTTAFEGSSQKVRTFFGAAPPAGFDGYHFRPSSAVVLSDAHFRLRYAENPAAAFGLFHSVPEGARALLFHLVSLGAVVLIGYYSSKLTGAPVERWARWGLPLVLGGALGNYVDRLARGFVIDFLEAHWYERAWWPAFNVADIAISVGVAMLVIDAMVRKETTVEKAAVA